MEDFNKIILGEDERVEFEDLLLREKLIDSVQQDFNGLVDMNEEIFRAKSHRITNKRRLLIFLMLFDKFDATNLSVFDFSRLIDLGIIDDDSCITFGTDNDHPTSIIIDNMRKYQKSFISKLLGETDSIFFMNRIDIYSRNFISDELLLDLCDCFLNRTKQEFYAEYIKIITIIMKNYYRSQFSGKDILYGPEIIIDPDLLGKIKGEISYRLDEIYTKVGPTRYNRSNVSNYCSLIEKLDANIQKYYISDSCISCDLSWEKCCNNSEFLYSCNFKCPHRKKLGEQRYAKLNGLIMSHWENATLFDNSIQFHNIVNNSSKIIEDIYYIVNVDLSSLVANLPIPQTVKEALRLRKREEMQSFRKIFLQWANCLYNGEINEAEYIKKDFDAAIKFFEKKNSLSQKKKSLWRCSFEALGNQIPYLSNLLGFVSPFINRKTILEEEKYKWLLLTR